MRKMYKPVGFKADPSLWRRFKAKVYSDGLEIGRVMNAFIRLYIEDPEVNARVRDEARRLVMEEA